MSSKVLAIALKEVGTTENPPDSNRTKYSDWFGLSGVPWCAIFVSWCYYMAGLGDLLRGLGYQKGFAGTQSALYEFKKRGCIIPASEAIPGDIVFFDWQLDGRPDHVGIFKCKISDTVFESIEGNTAIGNDSNGGEVMVRRRNYRVAIFVRPR